MSKIEWTEQTWNPVTGCTKCSPGCANCYALTMSRRLAGMGQEKYKGVVGPGGWTGMVRCHGEVLNVPRSRKRPTVWFVNSMSDTFHKDIPLGFFTVMWMAMVQNTRHRFLLLTKRPGRVARLLGPLGIGFYAVERPVPRPQPNIAIGVTVCNQDEWDKKVPILCQIPAAMRFVSVEPMLGHINATNLDGVHWVICGCESGPWRRATMRSWVSDLRDQVKRAGVPFFLKQLEAASKIEKMPELDGKVWDERPEWFFAPTPAPSDEGENGE